MSVSHSFNLQRFMPAARCGTGPGGWALACLLGVLFCGQMARAQEESTPVYGGQQKRQWLSLDPIEGLFEFEARHTENKIDDKQTREKDTENLYTEYLTLSTHGAIIHPNVVELNLSGTFGLRQRDFKETLNGANNSLSENGTVTGYDVSATFLRREQLTLTLYAQRFEDNVNRDFGPSLINTTSTFGATADLRLERFPTHVQIYHTDQTLDDPANLQGYTQKQNSLLWHTEWIPTERSHLTFDYTYNSIQEKAQLAQPLNFDVNQIALSHIITFGADLRSSLTSTLDYLDQTGDFAEERLRLSEQLTLQHSKELQSYLRYSYTQDSRDAFDQSIHQGEIGFEHKLYQSLITRGAAGFQIIDDTGQDLSQEAYARLDFNYTKKVPYGVLGLALGTAYDYRNNASQASPVEILDEAHTMTDPLGIVIVRTNLDPKSIVLTSANNLRVYVPGIDYIVQSQPNRVLIQRVLGGAIADGQPLLVDYSLLPQPGNTQDTINFAFGGRYDIDQGLLKGLSVHARYFFQRQSISSEDPSAFIPDNINDVTIGADYRIGYLTLSAEQEWHDSTLAPYNSSRFTASYTRRLVDAMVLSLGASYTMIDYTDINEHLKYLNLSSTLDYQITREWHALATVTYRDQNDSLFGNTRGFEQELQIQWRHRQTFFYATLRNSDLDYQGQDTSYQLFLIGIQRKF